MIQRLEFLGIKEQKPLLEKDLEVKLIRHIEEFLLELGKGFMYVGSQQRISLNNVDKFEYPGGMVFKSGNYYSVYYGRGSEAITKFTIDSSYSYNKSDLIITEKAVFSFNDPANETTEMIYTNTSKTNKIDSKFHPTGKA